MCDLNQLGKNIRSLRNAYGETLEQLGEAIHAAKNTVSNYETGKRKLGRETIIAISRHYMISVEELMNSDLTSIPKPAFDKDAFWKNIDIIFPIVSSKKHRKTTISKRRMMRTWHFTVNYMQ